MEAGLTKHQLWRDSQQGLLKIVRRGTKNNTLIDAASIKHPAHLPKIEKIFGRLDTIEEKQDKIMNQLDALARSITALVDNNLRQSELISLLATRIENIGRQTDFTAQTPQPPQPPQQETIPWGEPVIDEAVQASFIAFRKENGRALSRQQIMQLTNRCAILEACRKALKRHAEARAKAGKKPVMGDFFAAAQKYYMQKALNYPCTPVTNVRRFADLFNRYLNALKEDDMTLMMHKSINNDHARKVSPKAENLILALWKNKNKPYKKEVTRLYNEFATGNEVIVDKETGEVFDPKDFRYKGRPMNISGATSWKIITDPLNDVATATRRDGNYHTMVEKRPFVFRSNPLMSLSKISMDDADLSRKMTNGESVHRYMAFDVASGYWFTPSYSPNPLTVEDVIQCFRNMFCELDIYGLPVPGEIEHEHHLMDNLMEKGLRKCFPFTTISSHSRNKRAEHGIKSLKWGVAHKNNHTYGRFYGIGVYRKVRFKSKGEFKEKRFGYEEIVMDDLRDIMEHNNALHPNQELYPGKTRYQVFLENYNCNLPVPEKHYLYYFIGNKTCTTIRNNNHFKCNHETYLIDDFACLKAMKPNNNRIEAYWIPEGDDGRAAQVYLYQGEQYIGSASPVANLVFNEARVEQTPDDIHRMNAQLGRISHFDKIVRDINTAIPNVMHHTQKVEDDITQITHELQAIADNTHPETHCKEDDIDLSEYEEYDIAPNIIAF